MYHQLMQPSAEYLGSRLGVDEWAINIFTEEIIRAGSAASLSSLLNRLDPILRQTAHLGSWQQNLLEGEEEIPDGVVAVLTPDMPDVLSHVSVRARNSKVCFATCFDPNLLAGIQANEGKLLQLKPTSADVVYSVVKEDELTSSTNSSEVASSPSVTLIRKQFGGRYAISS
ncbi:Alpha-glucan water dikinase 1 [Abeliophyllum distichum]|uniref:Alpha-glucan water dikinase 1 n=1 Tax=Abeliophyllum distichum TaxID=126358 RepID=A0ABD1W0S1_9LAMI